MITAMQALEALDELESSARGDEPFNHAAAPVVRAFIEGTHLAKTDTAPAWKDAPDVPGLWVSETCECLIVTDMDADAMFWRALDAGRWFGPIPS